MKQATKSEFYDAIRRGCDVRRMYGKRYQSFYYSYCGTEVAEEHRSLTRGKVVSTTYSVNPQFLTKGDE